MPTSWTVTLELNGTPTDLMIDTGAEVTVIRRDTPIALSSTDVTLKGTQQPLSACKRVILRVLGARHQRNKTGHICLCLEQMERLGVIARVEQPTDSCAGLVVVPKPNGKVRICADLTKLNESVRWERHPLPAVDQVLAQLSGATIFSKLDANSGFWQVPLSPDSALLTTFITPFGRFCFHRLPFGISSSPEIFQRIMSQMLAGLPGTVCMMDDVLVHGATQEEHDDRLHRVLKWIQDSGMTLNPENGEFSCNCVKFLGHVIDKSGIRHDPNKIQGIVQTATLLDVSDVRRFLGTVNQMRKFSPHLADSTRPLRELLERDSVWHWGDQQQTAFDNIKAQLTSAPVLALFDPSR
jgi:hypothetical protein